MHMNTALISDIKRFSVHDGDGIRTTAFFKGCPLRCIWCHNPEGISPMPQTAYYKDKCIACGECAGVCRAHSLAGGVHSFDRGLCTSRGSCESVCLGSALKLYGRRLDVGALVEKLLADKDFYDNSGGGVTLSGGEPLMQADFCAELLAELKKSSVRTAVDTCGFADWTAFGKVIPYTDIFLYDIKAIDEQLHIRCTGRSNRVILENLRRLDAIGKPVEIRFPYVPGYNSGETAKIAEFLSGLTCITKVRVLPYHRLAGSKYRALGMQSRLPEKLPSGDELAAAAKLMRSYGLTVQS